MTHEQQEDSEERKQTHTVFTLFLDSVLDYEENNPEALVTDRAVFNASITMMYHVLAHTYEDDVVGIRKALDAAVDAVIAHARKANITEVKTVH